MHKAEVVSGADRRIDPVGFSVRIVHLHQNRVGAVCTIPNPWAE